MAVIASEPKGSKYTTPAGNHLAVCYAVWDLGEQEVKWQDYTQLKHQVIIAWEINEVIDDQENEEYHGKRYVISRTYNLSLHAKSALRGDLENWRGKPFTSEELKGFDLEKLIGACCMLQVVHKTTDKGVYANIGTVGTLPKGAVKMVPENSSEPHEWVKKKQEKAATEQSDEYQEEPPMGFNQNEQYPENDLPF